MYYVVDGQVSIYLEKRERGAGAAKQLGEGRLLASWVVLISRALRR